jgi:hypothetical protein
MPILTGASVDSANGQVLLTKDLPLIMMMTGLMIDMPRGWGEVRNPMSLRLVTPEYHSEMLEPAESGVPGAGVVIGVFCGSMFWIGLGIGWALWG